VAAWRIYRATIPILCRSDIVAVDNAHRHNGYGLALKKFVIDTARAAGAAAVTSRVDRRNVRMLALNELVGGVVDQGDDPDNCICVISLDDSLAT